MDKKRFVEKVKDYGCLLLKFCLIFSVSIGLYGLIRCSINQSDFDSTDKANFVQIALFAGAILAVIEARNLQEETTKLQKYTLELQEKDYLPSLIMFVRDVKKNGKYWKYRFFEKNNVGKYFTIRNVGKGPAINLSITILGDSKLSGVSPHQLSLAPEDDETPIQVFKSKKVPYRSGNYNDLNNTNFKVEVITTVEEKSRFYGFSVRDIKKGHIIRTIETWEEGDLGKNR